MKPWLEEARRMREQGKSYTDIGRAIKCSPSSVWYALNPSGRKPGPRPLLAEAKRKQWADPEWAARQRKRISDGMQRSDYDAYRREPDERPAYHPLHDNPRMKRILGGSA